MALRYFTDNSKVLLILELAFDFTNAYQLSYKCVCACVCVCVCVLILIMNKYGTFQLRIRSEFLNFYIRTLSVLVIAFISCI